MFWDHVEVKNWLGGSMDAPFVSDFDLRSSTSPILDGFGKLLGSFWNYFGIFCGYKFHEEFLYDFKMICHGF